MKVFGRTGVRIYHPPIKVRIQHIDLIGLDTECAWRGGQNVNMDLLHVAHLGPELQCLLKVKVDLNCRT